jgi:hypothetical protein
MDAVSITFANCEQSDVRYKELAIHDCLLLETVPQAEGTHGKPSSHVAVIIAASPILLPTSDFHPVIENRKRFTSRILVAGCGQRLDSTGRVLSRPYKTLICHHASRGSGNISVPAARLRADAVL